MGGWRSWRRRDERGGQGFLNVVFGGSPRLETRIRAVSRVESTAWPFHPENRMEDVAVAAFPGGQIGYPVALTVSASGSVARSPLREFRQPGRSERWNRKAPPQHLQTKVSGRASGGSGAVTAKP